MENKNLRLEDEERKNKEKKLKRDIKKLKKISKLQILDNAIDKMLSQPTKEKKVAIKVKEETNKKKKK